MSFTVLLRKNCEWLNEYMANLFRKDEFNESPKEKCNERRKG
jgi:hypothetical protein